MKKILVLVFFVFCGFLQAEKIHLISREMGSGTRGAFVDIFEIKKQIGKKKVDSISKSAEVTNSTGVMMVSVANSKNAIGYISLGSLNDTIKALSIDGNAPNVENIIKGTYKISRPFNVITKNKSALSEDFLAYVKSQEAKAVIEKNGYISITKEKFASKKPKGKLVIAGSSSIAPLMEKLKESYEKINTNAKLEILQSDSTTGVNSTIEGISDIGMVSRELKESELKKGIEVQVLALDGLAVIVNKNNALINISKENIKKIFSGEITSWNEIK